MKLTYWGNELVGFDHPYNDTILNERAVELAVAEWWLAQHAGRGLEVGNVLGHYEISGHRVVDLYEQAPGVENIDVFDIEGSYDWIVSISTLEHVGSAEGGPIDHFAPERAFVHLLDLLGPAGALLVTAPLGCQATYDDFLIHSAPRRIDRACTFVRDGEGWVQTPELATRPYGVTTPWADAVWIGEYERTTP